MSEQLAGMRVLVNGASRGIGAAVARLAAAEGAQVLVTALHRGPIEALAASIRADGGDVLAEVADVRRAADHDRVIDRAVRKWGGLDGVANVVGGPDTPHLRPLTEITLDSWTRTFHRNVLSVYLGLRRQIPLLTEGGGGSIVNLGSYLASRGGDGRADYAAAKAALVGLSRAAALECASSHVRVNVLAPGGVRTQQLLDAVGPDPDAMAAAHRFHPLGHVAEPEDVAAQVLNLLSPGAACITGAVIPVDCGLTA